LSKVTSFKIAEKLAQRIPLNLDIGLVIHNAGSSITGRFTKLASEDAEMMVNINSLAPYFITKAFLPRLLKRKERSVVLNVSSGASLFPMPGFFTYSASKAFLSYFAEGLSQEMKFEGKTIDVVNYTPMGVATKMSEMKADLFIKTPELAAKSSLDSLGW